MKRANSKTHAAKASTGERDRDRADARRRPVQHAAETSLEASATPLAAAAETSPWTRYIDSRLRQFSLRC